MIITTNSQQPSAEIRPKKLNHITTQIIPNAPEVAPEIKGADLSKMITTNDEKRVEVRFDLIEGNLPEASDKVKKIVAKINGDDVDMVKAKKKAGRPKKAE